MADFNTTLGRYGTVPAPSSSLSRADGLLFPSRSTDWSRKTRSRTPHPLLVALKEALRKIGNIDFPKQNSEGGRERGGQDGKERRARQSSKLGGAKVLLQMCYLSLDWHNSGD